MGWSILNISLGERASSYFVDLRNLESGYNRTEHPILWNWPAIGCFRVYQGHRQDLGGLGGCEHRKHDRLGLRGDKTKLIATLVLRQKGKIYWPIFQLAELVFFRACTMCV